MPHHLYVLSMGLQHTHLVEDLNYSYPRQIIINISLFLFFSLVWSFPTTVTDLTDQVQVR